MVETLVPLVAALVMIVVVPGPNVVAIVTTSMRDRRAGLWTAAGVTAGDLLWATAALAGLGALLRHSQPLFSLLRWLGAVYLVLMAIRLWREGGRTATPARARPTRRPFLSGLLVDLANPKAAVFFTSLYASLLPPQLTVLTAMVVLATTMLIVCSWSVLLVLLLSQPPAQRLYRRARRVVTRLSAGAMGALGLRLALSE